MVNMKMSPEEAKEQYGESAVSEAPQYPYGLEVHLDEEALEKLGIHALPQVGQTMMMTARVEVRSVHQHDTQAGKEQRVDLQITDMELGPDQSSDAGKALYGDGG